MLRVPVGKYLDWLKWSVRLRWRLDDDLVAGPDLAACQDDSHDAGLTEKRTMLIARQDSSHQPWMEGVQLGAGVAEASYFDDCGVAKMQARTGGKSKQINTACRDILAHLSG